MSASSQTFIHIQISLSLVMHLAMGRILFFVFFKKKDHPCNTNQAHLGFVKRCLGMVFRLALIPHLTHLQLKGPSLSLHVLPSVRSLCPDQTQLSALLLSLLFQLPSDGASKGRAKTEKDVSFMMSSLSLGNIK